MHRFSVYGNLPPLYSLMASDKASMDSMSRLLVGSSLKMKQEAKEIQTIYYIFIPNLSDVFRHAAVHHSPKSGRPVGDKKVQQILLLLSGHLIM